MDSLSYSKTFKFNIFLCIAIIIIALGGLLYEEFSRWSRSDARNLQESPEVFRVRDSFESYINATVNNNGQAALDLLDTKTKDYYKTALSIVLYAEREDVERLDALDKFLVLRSRNVIPKQQLVTFQGDDLLLYALNNGMIGKDIVRLKIQNQNIRTNGNFAQAIIEEAGGRFTLNFYKEDNIWKIDITSVLKNARFLYDKIQKELNMDDNEFVFYLLEADGIKPTDDVWLPIISKESEVI